MSNPDPATPTLLEDLIRRTRQFVAGAAVDCVQSLVGNFVRKAIAQMTSHLVAALILGASAVFLMIAGAEGLRSAGLAPWLADLLLGLAGLAAGGTLLLCSRSCDRKAS